MAKKVPCEVYSRIVGYFRPVQNWNEGKKQEFQDRKVFVPRDVEMTAEPTVSSIPMTSCTTCAPDLQDETTGPTLS